MLDNTFKLWKSKEVQYFYPLYIILLQILIIYIYIYIFINVILQNVYNNAYY